MLHPTDCYYSYPQALLPVRMLRVSLAFAAIFASGFATSKSMAIVVSGANTTAPADDPGWNNVTTTTSAVYLGDNWMLGARHTGAPANITLNGVLYPVIPNSIREINNPTGMGLTAVTDLIMYRVDGIFSLPSVTISASTPPVNSVVTFIGDGLYRDANPTTWYINEIGGDADNNGLPDWSWSTNPSDPHTMVKSGYKNGVSGAQRWARNTIENGSNYSNSTIGIDLISKVSTKDVIGLVTDYDYTGGIANEGQVLSGDSGGGVFYKRNGNWELAGIIHATFNFDHQPQNTAVHGMLSFFSDLSFYRAEIESIRAIQQYSLLGDINLDGVVSGDGTGSYANDDLSAFIQGWGSTNGLGTGNITSWKLGDLDLDGDTDINDFAILRSVHPDASSIGSSFGLGNSVPEPSSILLTLVLSGFVTCILRMRNRKSRLLS